MSKSQDDQREERTPRFVPLRIKIIGAFLMILILFGSFASFSIVKVQEVKHDLTLLNDGYVPLMRLVTQMEGYESKQSSLQSPLSGGAINPVQETVLRIARLVLVRKSESVRVEATDLVGRLRARARAGGEMQKILELAEEVIETQQRFKRFNLQSIEFYENIQHYTLGERLQFLQQLRGLQEEYQQKLDNLGRLIAEKRISLSRRAEEHQSSAILGIGLLTASIIMLGVLILFWINHMLEPIGELTRGARTISTGDYRHKVRESRRNEIGRLAAEFNLMARSILDRETALTTQKEELDRLRLFNRNMVDSIRIAMIVVDPEGRVTFMNRAVETLFGMDPDAETGVLLHHLSLFRQAPELLGQVASRISPHPGRELGVHPWRDADGHQLLLTVSALPFRDETGAYLGTILLLEDVTTREEERARFIRNERLAAIGKMTAQVTHEIRNPLSTMSLNLEVLREELAERLGEEEDSAGLRRLIASIDKEIARLGGITEEYLTFARLPAPVLSRCDINEILRETLTFHAETLQQQRIECRLHLPPHPLEAMVNPQQLRQVFLNLIGNSIAAMEETGEVHIRAAVEDGNIRIRFLDNGPGIDEDNLHRIFEPFFTTKPTGTGLGLAVSRQIVEEHGGTIRAHNRQTGGSEFIVELPLADAQNGQGKENGANVTSGSGG